MSKNRRKMERHHIIPRSRGGGEEKWNIAQVSSRSHRSYHSLFGDRNPREILEYLVKDFWNGQAFWVYRFLDREEEK